MKKTPLFEIHTALKAKMMPFANFEMPVQYESAKSEIESVRNEAGLFDVSHMGEFFVTGKETEDFIDYIITNDFKNAPDGKAVYSPICNHEGMIIDDLIAYKFGSDSALLCVNASNIDKDWSWISQFAEKFECEITNESDNYSLLALQGPNSEKIMAQVFKTNSSIISKLPYYGVAKILDEKNEFIIARTGYTGEDGFEVFCLNSNVSTIWNSMLHEGAKPCGLASRDTLRIEVCYPLYGNELTESITPLESGLKWTVKMEKNAFVGKEALEKAKPGYKLIKLSLASGIPRSGHKIYKNNNEEVGLVTSGTFSPTLSHGVAIGLVKKDAVGKEDDLLIEIRGKQYPARKHNKNFLEGGHK